MKDDAPFDDVLRFRTRLLPYDGNADWVEPTLMAAAHCLGLPYAPAARDSCAYCKFVRAAGTDAGAEQAGGASRAA